MKKVILVLLSLFALSAIGEAEAAVGFERAHESVLVDRDSTYPIAWTTGSHYFTPSQCSVSVLSKKFSAKGDSDFRAIVGKGFMNRSIFGYSRFTSVVSFDKSFIAGLSPSSVKPVSVNVSCSNDKGEADSGTIVVNLIKKAYLSISPSGSVTIKRNEDLSIAANWGEESARNCSYEISNYEGSNGGILVGGKFPVSGSKIKGESARLNLRCWQRLGDEKESVSVVINVVDEPRIGIGDLRKLDSSSGENYSSSVPELTPDQYVDVFGTPDPALSGLLRNSPSQENGAAPAADTLISDDSVAGKPSSLVSDASPCPCGRDASGRCSDPVHNKKCAGGYLVDYYYCPGKSEYDAIENNLSYPKTFDNNNVSCKETFSKEVDPCSVCGRDASGKCLSPVHNKKCAGGYLVDYYHCPGKPENEPILDHPSYPRILDNNNASCKQALEKEVNPTCLPCGADSNGNCVKPESYNRCSANEDHKGERASFYACANQPNPLDNPILNSSKFPVNYVKDSSCLSLYKPNTSVSPVPDLSSDSSRPSGNKTESNTSSGKSANAASGCDSPCGTNSSGACVKPERYNRCSANEEFKRAYFYACPNKPNPIDNPILGNDAYRVSYVNDAKNCPRPYIPGSGGSSSGPSSPTPSGTSGSQTPSVGAAPSTGDTNAPTAPTVSAPKTIDCSACSQCGCNSDKTACVQPVTKGRCSNNKPGYWATFQACPGTDTPAPGTTPSYSPDPSRCQTNSPTPAWRATNRFFSSIIEGLSSFFSN